MVNTDLFYNRNSFLCEIRLAEKRGIFRNNISGVAFNENKEQLLEIIQPNVFDDDIIEEEE